MADEQKQPEESPPEDEATVAPALPEAAADEPEAGPPPADAAAATPVVDEPALEEVAAEAAPADDAAADPEPEQPAESEPAEAAAEPVPAEVPAEETVAVQPAAPAPVSQPKGNKKRLPRAERRQRPRPKRAESGERKPIVRVPRPESPRGRRQERRGVVVSSAMDKTIVVRVETVKAHPRYKKVVRRSTKFHAHDERNTAKVGDVVRIVETRPLSKTKHWRLAEVVEAAR